MSGPPYELDITDPADTAITAQFPTNERAFRAAVSGYLNTEHDFNTGYHAFQLLSTSGIAGLTTPPAGMLLYNTSLGVGQINTGTSSVPVWTNIGGVPASLTQVTYPIITAYTALVGDSGTLFSSLSTGGAFTLTLPLPSTIAPGWTCGVVVEGNGITVIPNATGGAKILLPTNQSVTTITPNNSTYEMITFKFDGANFRVLSMTLQTALDYAFGTQQSNAPNNQGTIIFRGATQWQALAPAALGVGTALGPFLATGGVPVGGIGYNPSWETITPTFANKFASNTLGVPANGSSTQVAHGLQSWNGSSFVAAIPFGTAAYLICTTANLSYSVGDCVPIGLSSTGSNGGIIVYFNTTYIGASVGNSGIQIIPKGGGNLTTITSADWGLVLQAWL